MKILIWGTGEIATRVLNNGLNGEVIGFLETVKSRNVYMGYPVYDINKFSDNFDLIIVANNFTDEIYSLCQKKKIDLDKVIFLRKGNGNYFKNIPDLRNVLGEKNYTYYLAEYGAYKGSFFEDDMEKYKSLNTRKSFMIQEEYLRPIISNKYAMAGTMGNYFWQDLWAAKNIILDGVKEHYDIGSRLDGFIAHLLAAGIKVNMVDIRPFPGKVENLYTVVDDAAKMKNIRNNSLTSISALCSLEHFGLGRYGDEINPEACFECFEQIQNKLKSGGKLYISVPIGKERVEFNAHRVFFASTIIDSFNKLKLLEYSCVANNCIEYDVDINKYDDCTKDGNYRYGLFKFQK